MASDGVIAGFARPENTLILRLQSRRSIGDLTKGEVGAAAINIGRPPCKPPFAYKTCQAKPLAKEQRR